MLAETVIISVLVLTSYMIIGDCINNIKNSKPWIQKRNYFLQDEKAGVDLTEEQTFEVKTNYSQNYIMEIKNNDQI